MEGSNTLTFDNWKSLTEIFGIFPMGLNAQEIKVMRILAEHTVLSCHNIAVMMMVEEENISSEIEVRPKELGLIENTPKGRKLTTSGIAYLKKVA
jgi:Holliday junction DNA helicase RuvB